MNSTPDILHFYMFFDGLSWLGHRLLWGSVYLAPLWVLQPGFKTSHLQVDRATATLWAKWHVSHKIMNPPPPQNVQPFTDQFIDLVSMCQTCRSFCACSIVAARTSSPLIDRIWSPSNKLPSESATPPLMISDTNMPVSLLSERKQRSKTVSFPRL